MRQYFMDQMAESFLRYTQTKHAMTKPLAIGMVIEIERFGVKVFDPGDSTNASHKLPIGRKIVGIEAEHPAHQASARLEGKPKNSGFESFGRKLVSSTEFFGERHNRPSDFPTTRDDPRFRKTGATFNAAHFLSALDVSAYFAPATKPGARKARFLSAGEETSARPLRPGDRNQPA